MVSSKAGNPGSVYTFRGSEVSGRRFRSALSGELPRHDGDDMDADVERSDGSGYMEYDLVDDDDVRRTLRSENSRERARASSGTMAAVLQFNPENRPSTVTGGFATPGGRSDISYNTARGTSVGRLTTTS